MSKLKIELIGHLGRDAEGRMRDDGSCAINFSVATVERWRDKDGNRMEKTNWVDCVLWRKRDNLKIMEFLRKGLLVSIEGVPSVNVWMDKQNNVPRGSLVVRVDQIIMLGAAPKPSTVGSSSEVVAPAVDQTSESSPEQKVFVAIGANEDLPF